MTKKKIFILIGFFIILIAIPVTLYLVRQTQIFAPKAAFVTKVEFVDAQGNTITETTNPNVKLKITKESVQPAQSPSPTPRESPSPASPATIDTLDYFVSDHPDKGLDGEHETGSLTDNINGHPLSQTVEGQTAYYTKWDPMVFERFTWDNNFIYLKEDHSGAPVNFYSFTPGTWMKRQMQAGDKVTVPDNVIQWYDSTCHPVTQSSFPIELTLERQDSEYDLGGELGIQDVIVIKYDSSVGLSAGLYERMYYSKQWGLVRWEEYDKGTNNLRNRRTFNKISQTKIEPNKEAACIE